MANPTYNLLETLSSYCICKYNDFKKSLNKGTKQKILGCYIVWVIYKMYEARARKKLIFFKACGVSI